MSKIIDLSLLVENGMPTCGTAWHQTVSIERMGTVDTVGRSTSKIVLGSHSGTHMDAPLHFLNGGGDITALDLNILCGPIKIVDLTKYGKGDVVPLSAIKDLNVSERMLFRFKWYEKWKTEDYYNGFPYFSSEAVDYLINNGMKLMAMDTPSPDDGSAITSLEDDSPNHKKLLRAGVVIIEYLNDTEKLLDNKNYEIFALPLKLKNSDGSPSRIIAREI